MPRIMSALATPHDFAAPRPPHSTLYRLGANRHCNVGGNSTLVTSLGTRHTFEFRIWDHYHTTLIWPPPPTGAWTAPFRLIPAPPQGNPPAPPPAAPPVELPPPPPPPPLSWSSAPFPP